MPEKNVQKEPGKKPAPSKKPKPQQEVVVQISLSELHPFPEHPFQLREDASIQLNGTLHYTTFSGGATVERFKRYLETDLLPRLNGNSVLVMDNMKSHHAKAVKELLDSSGVRYIYLPPYSPDLNPIEKLWSKVKALLRKFKARTLDALPNAIQNAFHSVTVSDCSGWFRFCGYAL